MADPLSIFGSIAGLLSLGGSILMHGITYTVSVRDSPDALRQLLGEISRLNAVLGQINQLVSTDNGSTESQRQRLSEVITKESLRTGTELLNSVLGSIKSCQRIRGEGIKNVGKALIWPFKERDVQTTVERFRRLIGTYESALQVESSHMLRNVHKRTSDILEEQQDAKRRKLSVDHGFRNQINDNIIIATDTLGIAMGIHSAVRDNAETITNLGVSAEEERVRNLLGMLSGPLESPKRHCNIQSTRHEGSGVWLLEHQRFRLWRDSLNQATSSDRILCCYGIPGAGKTIMSSIVIQHLINLQYKVAFLYCDYRDEKDQTLLNILGHLLEQLLAATSKVPDAIITLLDDIQRAGKSLTISDISQILRLAMMTPNPSRLFICIDALDELLPRVRLDLLKALQSEFGSAQIFLTGRNQIESEVQSICQVREHDAIDIIANSDDIRQYLTREIEKDAEANPDDMNDKLSEEILEAITNRAQGMFLLPALHIGMVLEQPTIAKRRRALTSLPSGLNDAYSRMLQRIQNSSRLRDLGLRALMWLHVATRPLKLCELQHALAVELKQGEPGNMELDEDAVPTRKRLLDCCLGLVIVDEETMTVRFVHYTLEEHLRTHADALFPDARAIAAEVCLTYLNFGELTAGNEAECEAESSLSEADSEDELSEIETEPEMERSLDRFWFLRYAAWNWGHYAERPGNWRDTVASLAINVLEGRGSPHIAHRVLYRDLVKQMAYDIRRKVTYLRLVTKDTRIWHKFTGIHVAAFFGLDTYITSCSENSCWAWNVRDATGKTPLSWAAEYGHEAVVRLLVEREDVDADAKDENGRTPLAFSAERGHEAVVRLLVEREDVDADSKDRDGQTPLAFAAERGHGDVVRLLVEQEDVDADSKSKNGQTPLSHAAQNGHEAVVRLLVEREDVDADSKDRDGQTPLAFAAERGHGDVVRLLVEREDVDADAKDENGQTPLSYAARHGHEAVVRLLVERENVDADSKDSRYGQTPLSYAAQRGHEAIVRLLVEREDVDADSKGETGQTPLSYAAQHGHEAIVRLLVEREDVDADSKGETGRSPLSYAAQYGHEAIVRLLVEREDVDADSKDSQYGQTPLSHAAESGYEVIVRLLVEREDVDADSKDSQYGQTPLSHAAERGYEAIVRLLVEREDVDADSKDSRYGRTPLLYAARHGHEDVVRLLVERGDVDANSKDWFGRTPLAHAAGNGHEAIVRLFVEREDVDADSKDSDSLLCGHAYGQTPLSHAAEYGHEAVVRLLRRHHQGPLLQPPIEEVE